MAQGGAGHQELGKKENHPFFLYFQMIRRCIEKKTVEVYNLFVGEMNLVKQLIAKKSSPQTFAQPKYAGGGHWARFLRKRLEKQMMVRTGLDLTLADLWGRNRSVGSVLGALF